MATMSPVYRLAYQRHAGDLWRYLRLGEPQEERGLVVDVALLPPPALPPPLPWTTMERDLAEHVAGILARKVHAVELRVERSEHVWTKA